MIRDCYMMQVKVQVTPGRSGSKAFHVVSDHNTDGLVTAQRLPNQWVFARNSFRVAFASLFFTFRLFLIFWGVASGTIHFSGRNVYFMFLLVKFVILFLLLKWISSLVADRTRQEFVVSWYQETVSSPWLNVICQTRERKAWRPGHLSLREFVYSLEDIFPLWIVINDVIKRIDICREEILENGW